MSKLPKSPEKLQSEGVRIQQEFLEKRKRALKKAAGLDVETLEEAVKATYERYHHGDCPDWRAVLDRICYNLRHRDLTINFKAQSWFGNTNNYPSYTQTYQRNVIGDRSLLKDDSLNPADVRAVADDRVTLPEKWRHAPSGTQRRRIWDAMSFSGSYLPQNSAETEMDTMFDKDDKSKLKMVGRTAKSTKEGFDARRDDTRNMWNVFETTNATFNPHAKQVFAALNYGKRPHGSSIQYGMSYLILSKEMKESALYFPEDTFYFATGAHKEGPDDDRSVADLQTTYENLGNIIQWARPSMQDYLFLSCYEGHVIPDDTTQALDLLEAHIFSDVRIDRDVISAVLCREPTVTDARVWETIKRNAYEWGSRNKVRILIKSA
jgi:hypothetical protein